MGCPVHGTVVGTFSFLCRYHKAVDSSIWTEVTWTLNRYEVFLTLINAVDAGTIFPIAWDRHWSRWVADLVQKCAEELGEEELLSLVPGPYVNRRGETFPLESHTVWARRCEAYITAKALTEDRLQRSEKAKNRVTDDRGLTPAELVLCDVIKSIRLKTKNNKGDSYE
jgi:hypothetical protein